MITQWKPEDATGFISITLHIFSTDNRQIWELRALESILARQSRQHQSTNFFNNIYFWTAVS
jgi:hypothetical protein